MEPRTYPVTRADLRAYAEASGDHNPIHLDESVARAVGLPGVIAHGMFTLALAARYLEEEAGAAGRILQLGAKFTRPVVVGEDGAEVTLHGEERPDGSIALTVTCAGEKVLAGAVAVLAEAAR